VDFNNIYRRLPDWCQDIAITIKNVGVYYKKYNAIPIIRPIGSVQRKLINDTEYYSNASESDEKDKLKGLIKYAINNVEYYKERKALYKTPSDLEDIDNYPLLEKLDLRSNLDKVVSKEANSRNSVSFKTSGTTGTPLCGRIKISDLQLRFIVVLKSMNDFGLDLSKPYGRFPGAHISDGKRVYRRDMINNHIIFSMYHLSAAYADHYIKAINKYQLETLEGYPSVLYALALLIETAGGRTDCVKYVCTTAEKLHGYQKAKIEDVLGCKVFDYYGSSEQSSYIYMCPLQKYHNSNVISHLEVLDSEGNRTKPGHQGNMVVTSYTSTFTPLIRYKIGDSVLLSANQVCECGIGGLVIDEIIGRDEDAFLTLDGRSVSRFSLVLKYLPSNVFRAQLVLYNMQSNIELRYETLDKGAINNSEFDDFYKKLMLMIGNGYTMTYTHKEDIPLGKNGKFKAVIIH